jgi:hypothetical protein
MDRKELLAASPLRILETASGGHTGRGELAVVVARHGAGKTSFLVSAAVDALLSGRRLYHVSMEANVERVREYYEQIFNELAREHSLQDVQQVHVDMERRRRIHSFMGGSFSLEKLETALSFMREHASFEPDVIAIDGYPVEEAKPEQIEALRKLGHSFQAALWMTSIKHREEAVTDTDGIPAPVDSIKQQSRLIVDLETAAEGVKVRLLWPVADKTELPFVLDPTRMILRHNRPS